MRMGITIGEQSFNSIDSLHEGIRRQEIGIELVEGCNIQFLFEMRMVAQFLSVRGDVTIDDLREYAGRHSIEPSSPNAWGAVFKHPGWQCVGWQPSRIPSNHARPVRVWRRV